MTGRSRGFAAAAGAPLRAGIEAVRRSDEIFEALATGRPVSPEDTTVRLLRSLVADVSVGTQVTRAADTPAGRTPGDAPAVRTAMETPAGRAGREAPVARTEAPVARTEFVSRFPGASPGGAAGQARIGSGQARITESRGPLRCR